MTGTYYICSSWISPFRNWIPANSEDLTSALDADNAELRLEVSYRGWELLDGMGMGHFFLFRYTPEIEHRYPK